MTTTARQNNLILNQDWTRIYQTFKNADFQSYDFENLRRVIIAYLRENYPEDFNDYIESSEYMALIDAVAFLGQSLSFRIDLASRENFIELAERKESVLRLARMLSYNAKRNIAAQGLLKFTSVSTTESILDSNGKNLANQSVTWNDPTNSNWLEQFLLILNAAMADNTEFGRSQGSAVIGGIPTQQYRFNSLGIDVPIYSFNKSVAARGMTFEIVSTAFKNSESIYEEPPVPANQLGFVYRNDGTGPASGNTGFFILFKQGSLELADFNIAVPSTNEKIAVDSANINNDDVWLFKVGADGTQLDQWSQVSSLVGNNIAYNSISQNIRNIYSVITRSDDRIELQFADGVYGNLPQGSFRIYYRVSNGLTYNISPNEMRGITINVPYLSKEGTQQTISIGLALQSTVSNAAETESTDDVRVNAPASFYTQNRMITGEDYNLAPLTSSQEILKVKAINRTSSGISRNFEIIDASGKYSSVNVFADDGYIYKEEIERALSFTYVSRLDIINVIRRNIEPIFTATDVYNFYLTKYDKILFADENTLWEQVTTDVNLTTGYFKNAIDNTPLASGNGYATSNLKYVRAGALVKFGAPAGYAFKNGEIVVKNSSDSEQRDSLWTKVVKIVGAGNVISTTTGLGGIYFGDTIPTGAIAKQIVPVFINDLPIDIETEIVNQVSQNLNFGLRYSPVDSSWKIITAPNLNLIDSFSLGKAGDTSNTNIDSSWIIAFVREPNEYVVRIRGLDYIFGSVEQNRFYFDVNQKAYNNQAGQIVKDQIKVLGINTAGDSITPLVQTISFEITDTIKFDDGYESTSEIKLAFSDVDDDGIIDNPDAFEQIVGNDLSASTNLNYLFFREIKDDVGNVSFELVDTDLTPIYIEETEVRVNLSDYNVGDLIYFYDIAENRVKQVTLTSTGSKSLTLVSSLKGNIGRKNLKFQYLHNASVDRRIDPSSSNIMDVSLLTRAYDNAFRIYLAGGTDTEPIPPTSEELRVTFGSRLNAIKAISDEIIYQPVKYKILFGSKAPEKLQAQFKVVKNPNRTINDNDLKVRIVTAINEFFDVNNWDFGDRFYLSELTTYILNSVAPDVSNLVIVPRQAGQVFGSLFEIQSNHDEILISGATVDDIVIVTAISAAEVGASASSIVTTT